MVKPRPLYKKNGILLAELMRHGYTIDSLAKEVGVHYLTIWRIANNQHQPNRQTADKICACLQTSPAVLGFEIWGEKGFSKKTKGE
ncbi:MAG: helix-turn-helix transcriptional regulator [Lentisphaeria bacterium]|nr:helix-turn-helix domain-containing protein [Lentisphaeria bacterium]NQZ68425.1 helix-turn-helix transcriptional regulator [Lentisphaeria bacterium]